MFIVKIIYYFIYKPLFQQNKGGLKSGHAVNKETYGTKAEGDAGKAQGGLPVRMHQACGQVVSGKSLTRTLVRGRGL